MKFRDYSNYEIYSDGRIWSYRKNKFLKPYTNKDGYQQVTLTDDEGNKKTYYVHRVVWEAVTGEPILEGYEINHIDENKYNNSKSNLNLMSHKQNINYGSRNAKAAKARINGKRSKKVCAFKNGKLVITFQGTAEAGRQGFNQGAVSACCRNCFNREGNNVYKGYEWRYI